MLSNHLILCHPVLLLPSIFPSIRVSSDELALCIRCPKYWSFSISPSHEYSGCPLGLTGLISLQSKGLSRVFSNTTVQKHQFFGAQPLSWSSSHITMLTKVCVDKATVLPVVLYGCKSWTIKKAEHRRIDAFELWCWRRLLRVPWTARRSNQSILKEINPEYSLEGLMLKLKL